MSIYSLPSFTDAYGKVAPADYRAQDREREREEFERSGKFFKDLSGVMASRFTRSKVTEEDDDSKVSQRGYVKVLVLNVCL